VCLSLAGASAPAGAAEPTAELRSEHFRLELPAANRKTGERIVEVAESARASVLAQMPKPVEREIRLVWTANEAEFYRQIGRQRGHVLAAAAPEQWRVFLNGAAMRRLDPGDLRQTLVHELTHVYAGHFAGPDLPLWLDEGLAMVVAGEWGFDDSAALAGHSLVGGLIPIADLATAFPADASSQRMAYLESYSLTSFLISQRFARSGVKGLIADLADPKGGMRPLLADPDWLAGFEARWRKKGLGPGRLIIVLVSGTTLWTILAVVVIFAFLKKRRQRKRQEARWAFEEEFTYRSDEFDD
jgi:hypothetical protein